MNTQSLLHTVVRVAVCAVASAAGVVSAATIAELALLPDGAPGVASEVVVISTVDLTADPGMSSFQVRDMTRAMTIYGTNSQISAALTGFGPGDVIEIGGYINRTTGVFTLVAGSVSGFAVSGRTSTLPIVSGALAVTATDIALPNESQLVRLRNVAFDIGAGARSFAAETSYALVGSAVRVRIATSDLDLVGEPIPTEPVDITGVVILAPDGDGYVLAPRSMGDIVPACGLSADLNGDKVVDLSDLATLLAHFGEPSGETYAMGDIDGDGDIDLTDLSTLLAQFGLHC